MAQQPIKGSQIVESGALEPHIKEVKEALALYEKWNLELLETAKNAKAAAKNYSAGKSSDIKKAVAENDALTKAMINQEKVIKAKAITEKSLISLKKQQETQNKRNIRQLEQERNAYKQLTAQTNAAQAELKRLATVFGVNSKEARKAKIEFDKLDNQLREVNDVARDGRRDVGRYGLAIQGLRGTATSLIGTFQKLGLTIGTAFVARNIGGIIVDFSQAQGDLLAISGKTADELEVLTKQAKALGETTQFSATQITLMQVELAKLGFTVEQIEKSTEPVANFAAATGVELPRAATLAGSALRAFNLEASEMERVVSTLGVATTKSALDFGQLETGLSTVAPVANAFGFSIEETTALLGSLSNAGFDASSSATATRNILLNLADSNGDLAKSLGRPVEGLEDLIAGLKELDASGIDLATSLELTDKRSVAAFQTFLSGTDTIVELKNSITGANEELQEMAEKRLDTVGGQLTLLQSAWEGFILGADDATGASNALKNVLGFLAKNLGTILSVVTKVGIAWLSYKAAVIATNTVQKAGNIIMAIRTNGLKSLFVSQTAATTATASGTVAQKGLNTAMKANPIGLLISGLVVLTTQLGLFSSAAEIAAKKQQALNDAIKEGNDVAQKNKDILSKETDTFLESEKQKLLDKLRIGKEDALNKEQINKEVEKSAALIRFNAIQEKKDLTELIKLGQLRFKNAGDDGLLRGKISGELEVYAQREKELEELISGSRQVAWNWYLEKVKEVNTTKSKGNNDEEEALTGLAKLQKELAELEKKRSDYLVANKGIIDSTYISMTNQTRALKDQIDSYKFILDNAGKVQKAEKRTGEIATKKGKDGDIDRNTALPDGVGNNKKKKKVKVDARDIQTIAQNLTNVTVALANKRIEALDREAEAQQRLYEQSKEREQQIIAQRSASDASIAQSLAFEKQAQAAALKEQEKIAKKKARIELFNSGLTMLNSYVQQGKGVGEVVTDMATLTSALDALLPAFWSGTDTTVGDSVGMKYSNGRDGILARVDKSEMILNKSKVDTLGRYGVNSTDDIVQRVKMGSMFSTPVSTATDKIINVNNTELINKLDSTNNLLKTIASKPSTQFDINQLGNVVSITEKVTSGNKVITTTNHKRLGR